MTTGGGGWVRFGGWCNGTGVPGGVDPTEPGQVRPPDRAHLHDGAGVRGVDHQPVADVDAHVVDVRRPVEHQVAGQQLREGDRDGPGVLIGGHPGDGDARPVRHTNWVKPGAVERVRSGGAPRRTASPARRTPTSTPPSWWTEAPGGRPCGVNCREVAESSSLPAWDGQGRVIGGHLAGGRRDGRHGAELGEQALAARPSQRPPRPAAAVARRVRRF